MKKISIISLLLLSAPLHSLLADWSTGIGTAGTFALPNAMPENILINFLLWLTYILTIIAVLAFVISGIMFLTSGGNSEQTGRAKEFVKYSIIGIIVSLSGYIIIRLIDDILMGII